MDDPQSDARETSGIAPGRKYRDLTYLSRWLKALLTLSGLIAVGAVISDLMELDLVNRALEGRVVTPDELISNDDRQRAMGVVQLAIGVLTGLAFIAWTFVAYGNLQPLGAMGMRYGRGWAIGAWFIPIANFFIPKQIVNDIWRASDPEMEERSSRWKGTSVPFVITAWWGLLIVSGIVAQIAASGRGSADIEDFRASTQAYVASDALLALTAPVAIAMVRMIDARQQERYARLSEPDRHPSDISPP